MKATNRTINTNTKVDKRRQTETRETEDGRIWRVTINAETTQEKDETRPKTTRRIEMENQADERDRHRRTGEKTGHNDDMNLGRAINEARKTLKEDTREENARKVAKAHAEEERHDMWRHDQTNGEDERVDRTDESNTQPEEEHERRVAERTEENLECRRDRSDREEATAQAQNERDELNGLPQRRTDGHERWTTPIRENRPEEREKRNELEQKYAQARAKSNRTAEEEEERTDNRADEIRADQARTDEQIAKRN